MNCFKYSQKCIASIHKNFLPSLTFILFACENMAFCVKQDFSAYSFPQPTLSTVKCSREYSIYFFLWSVILNRLAVTKRAWKDGLCAPRDCNRSFSHEVTTAIFVYKTMDRRPCLSTKKIL